MMALRIIFFDGFGWFLGMRICPSIVLRICPSAVLRAGREDTEFFVQLSVLDKRVF